MLALTIRERTVHMAIREGDVCRHREAAKCQGDSVYFRVYEHRWTAERTTLPRGAMSVSNTIKCRVCIYKEQP